MKVEGLAMRYGMDMRRVLTKALCAGLALAPNAAAAHTGVHHVAGGSSFVSGFLHPVLGADHLVTMIAIGVWAAYLGGRAVVAVPLAFVAMMIVGAGLAAQGVALPAVENTIAVSLVVFGLLICMLAKWPAGAAAALVGVFAVFHGYAHGAEIPEPAQPLLYGAGFVLASILLLGIGVTVGRVCSRAVPPLVVRGAGAAIALFGLVTVAGWA